MSDVRVFNDFLPTEEFKYIQDNILKSLSFRYLTKSVYEEDLFMDNDKINNISVGLEVGAPQLVHLVYSDNEWVETTALDFIGSIIDKINPVSLYRLKINLQLPSKTPHISGWHKDMDCKNSLGTTALFNFTSNNGYTLLEDGTKIPSKENQLITFPSNIVHTGVTQTDDIPRVVLNLNYFL